MKIGILTFHSQLNYGGVLQCWALKTALEKLGHEVVVIDRWMDKENRLLWRGVDKWGLRKWWIAIKHAAIATGEWSILVRQWRTIRWMKRNWKLTPYHFCEWNEVKNVGVDAICVGSDQVWSFSEYFRPTVYMLEGLDEVPAIAYAVSMGMPRLPQEARELFSRGVRRFKSISVREKTGKAIMSSVGCDAVHVADPTLMVGRMFWRKLFPRKERRRLVCYIISESISPYLLMLREFARRQHCVVDVLLDVENNPMRYSGPFGGIKSAIRWMRRLLNSWTSPVRIHSSAGPLEFIRYFSQAKWVVSDSFHALMFSTIYEKNVRLIRPAMPFRIQMFSRISNFVDDYIQGQ